MGRARRLIETALVWVGKIELAICRRPRVLLAVTSLTSDRLLRTFSGGITPLVIAAWMPNLSSPRFIMRCLIEGVVAVKGSPEDILDAHRPTAMLIDGFGNPVIAEFARLAKLRGVKVFAIWHGPYYQDCKKDIFEHVDIILSWGKGNEEWLEANDVRLPIIRVGNPIA